MAIEITNPPAWPKESAGANMGTRSVLGSAGVGVVASSADTAIGALFNQAFAKRNAKLQYDIWRKMFDYQAEYNSPTNQLKRLYEAGINPLYNSEYGGSQGFQGGISSLPEQIGNGAFGENLERFLALMMENRKIDISENRAEAENARDYANAGEAVQNAKLTEVKTQVQYDSAMSQIRALDAQANLNDEERNYKKALQSQVWSYIQTQRNEVVQGWEKIFQGWRRLDIDFFTSNWQKAQGALARSTDREQMQENVRHNKAEEAIQRAQNSLKQQGINIEKGHLQMLIKDQNLKALKDIMEHAKSKLFGITSYDSQQLAEVAAIYENVSGIDPSVFENMPDEYKTYLGGIVEGCLNIYNRITNNGEYVIGGYNPAAAGNNPLGLPYLNGKVGGSSSPASLGGSSPKSLPGYQSLPKQGSYFKSSGRRVIQ